MPEPKELTAEERSFFQLVQDAGTANPFGERRGEMDREIASTTDLDGQAPPIEGTLHALDERVKKLEEENRGALEAFRGKDRQIMKSVFLFEFFYRFRKKFDDHIRAQIEADDKPVKLAFAGGAIAFLTSRGFNPTGVQHAIEIGYQMRRAFFFIRESLIGRSQAMQKLRHDLWNNIFTHNIDMYDAYLKGRMEDFSTLLLGETGTGKGTAAAAIGRSGFIPFNMKKRIFEDSFTNNFRSINLSQFAESLIESELFGHKKGAFTGAVDNYRGILENASPHGSILLDEIGEISNPVQIKLLQVLQERFFYPVGSHVKVPFHGRVIAATNRSIDDLRAQGVFRDDFYYRLCSDVIVVPPLRLRIREDSRELDDLLGHIVSRIVGAPSPELVKMVLQVIDRRLGPDYPWYGNVRELEQCVRRVLLKKDYLGDQIKVSPDLESTLAAALEKGDMPAQRLLSGYCKLLYMRHGSFEETARRTHLDRRTVAKYINEWNGGEDPEEE